MACGDCPRRHHWRIHVLHGQLPRLIAFLHPIHSAGESDPAVFHSDATAFGHRAHRELGPGTGQMLGPFEHLRQRDESWWSIRRESGQGLAACFF